ncbi:hypothetical protein B0H13DRAFT_2312852 [Mycena leptocephala]|nr:hypothetical protein B0H13DRAFT_2312852 [Mycena leptocephala]
MPSADWPLALPDLYQSAYGKVLALRYAVSRQTGNESTLPFATDLVDLLPFQPEARTRWFAFNPNASGSSKYQENISPLPSPQKPQHRSKRRTADDNIKTEHIDLSLDSDDDVQVLSSPNKGVAFFEDDNDNDSCHDRPPPRKKTKSSVAAQSDEEDDDSVDMSFFIEVETPAPPLLSVRTKNTKPPAPKTTLLGLFEFSSSISYPNFIRIVAQACRTQTENLRRPLTNAVGLGIAIKTLKERKKDYAFTLFMAPPSPIKAELPWLTNSNEDDPAGPLDFGFSIDELTAPGNSTLSLREQIISAFFLTVVHR